MGVVPPDDVPNMPIHQYMAMQFYFGEADNITEVGLKFVEPLALKVGEQAKVEIIRITRQVTEE